MTLEEKFEEIFDKNFDRLYYWKNDLCVYSANDSILGFISKDGKEMQEPLVVIKEYLKCDFLPLVSLKRRINHGTVAKIT